jgi:hypothetical protein
MNKYYLLAIEQNSTNSMCNLANYYQNIDQNYDLMKKYHLMAIDQNNTSSMNNLGLYYQNIEKDYDLTKKYFLMAIDLGDIRAMHNLACYYKNIEINPDLMKKYLLLAIDNDDHTSLNNLIIYYDTNKLLIDKLEFFIKYINKVEREKIIDIINNIAIMKLTPEEEKRFIDIIMNFELEEDDNVSSAIEILIATMKYKISISKLHFKYSLEGKGFAEAEADFYEKII